MLLRDCVSLRVETGFCLSFSLQCLEHAWHINIYPMNDQTVVLRSIWFITGAQLVFISINPLPPAVPVFWRREFWSEYPTEKEAACSLDAPREPPCCRICLVRLWEGSGIWAGLYAIAVSDGREGYFRRDKRIKNTEAKTCMGRPVGEEAKE